MFRSSSKCASGAQQCSETTTQVFEKHQTFQIEDPQLTCRVVTPKSNTGAGRIARQKALASMVVFRFSLASGSRTNALNENPSGLKGPTMSWLGPLQVSALGVAHSASCERTRLLGACARGVEMSKFSKILTLVRGSAL